MTRPRLYPDNASRQKAYRDRRLAQFKERGEIIQKLQQEISHLESEILDCPAIQYHTRRKDEPSS